VLIVCWSVKGGSGTTVVAAALSLLLARGHPDGAVAIDLDGDLPAALGVPTPNGPGIGDWLAADQSVSGDALLMLAADVGGNVELIGIGQPPDRAAARWPGAIDALVADPRPIVIDAGTHPPVPLLERATHSLLVLRPCYLALRRAMVRPAPATGVVLLNEPGRALGRRDVEAVVGVPVVAEVPVEPGIARAVDAGMLSCRLPITIARALQAVA
jgi:hypothetical protein